MCWVIPPASPAATFAERILSKRLVLPWSTCPSIVATTGRFVRFIRSFFSNSSLITSSRVIFGVMVSSHPKSIAISSAASLLIISLAVAKIPCCISLAIISAVLTARAAESVLTVTGSVTAAFVGLSTTCICLSIFVAILRTGLMRSLSPPTASRRARLSSYVSLSAHCKVFGFFRCVSQQLFGSFMMASLLVS